MEFEAYASLNHKIYEGNETEIFMLTGCLSTCDKYDYAIQPLTNLQATETDLFRPTTLRLTFVITTGRVEEKEQVELRIKSVWC